MPKMNRDGIWDVLVLVCFGAGALLLIIADLAVLIPHD
jgi:hypothetical protein